MLWVSLWVGVWLCVGRWVFSESQISLFVLSLACPLFGDAVVRVSCGGGGDAPPPPPPPPPPLLYTYPVNTGGGLQ